MENVILTQTTKDDLISQITKNVLSGIVQVLNDHWQKDLSSKEWLTPKETASLLKISSVTLWSWSKNGILQAHKVGRNVRYRKDEVLKALIRKEPKI